ncbi:MAG: hypothetical protein LR015_12040 [Verrucomicrobia bacterium]|nr:hypothetical protein [Verrucomicrobiota bacterium]
MKANTQAPPTSGSPDPWVLNWESDFENHQYEPVYIGNGSFGGMVDLSGADADWWSSEVGSLADGGHQGVLYPITLVRTAVLFRTAQWKSMGLCAGRSGIYCQDPRYTSDPSMPHRPQVLSL